MNTDSYCLIDGKLLEQELTEKIISCCFDVANTLGSGFLENVYQKSLVIALDQKGLSCQSQEPINVVFRGINVGCFYADIVVEKRVILEIKAVKALQTEFEAQLINYLKATSIRVGLLVNFGRQRLEWKRFVF